MWLRDKDHTRINRVFNVSNKRLITTAIHAFTQEKDVTENCKLYPEDIVETLMDLFASRYHPLGCNMEKLKS